MKKIAVLTSGGDAPGMNACVRAIIRSGIKNNCQMYVVYEGYKGLVEGRIELVDRNFVSDIINRGGTILRSSRLPEFTEEFMQKLAVKQLKENDIDNLICIGGDGTYRGALALEKQGINVVALPGSIDNDIASTDYTIGFDTCQNTIVDCVDKLRDTTASHQRCTFIEVMGNKCGDLALFSGIAEGVEMIITPEEKLTEDEVVKKLKSLKGGKKKHSLVIVSEKVYPNIHELVANVTEKTGIECRAEVLGHLQRGGSPTAKDRIEATRFGVAAIDAILENDTGVAIGLVNEKIVRTPLEDALAMKKGTHHELIKIIKLVNR